ncbi:MAG: 1,6-anhydro-N-acetylmuramyl-L-alanine amidase AmpD [SAR86 cluster bacterium]|uniref:1,6-anhydro-N-acetylmuramyl-L-alanine amidase AmpD n=1 Tax=SAR86 cluster bacterium TaxID=2030880 RepID=A0A2A4XH13_9GAMM|nr:MAG: 1,6-anhydro-N-acetylmuramyl-L-alanine amidase AmpD [SAR86 cluster bacterium]
MELSIANDILVGAQILESPNQDARPDNTDIELLVIHNISLPPGEFGAPAIKQFFCNELDSESHPFFREIVDLKVSAHLLIDRGGRLTQFVPFSNRAWHAGESLFCERSNCNDYSIGIELEGTDFESFTDSQYTSLANVTKLLLSTYPKMSGDKIVGHSDIAPGRKTDPGPCFDWAKYKQSLSA